MIGHYHWAGGTEALLRFGPDTGPVVAMILPPFEEANRTRAFAVAILRALAERGVAGVLPDLPGQGESLIPTGDATLAAWRAAFSAACASLRRPVIAASIRAGALVDTDATLVGRWHLSPQPGALLMRELNRIRHAAAREAGRTDGVQPPDCEAPVEVAGNRISPRLWAALADAQPTMAHPVRIVRLGTDALPADLRIDSAPLWRRAEPDQDIALAVRLADDLVAWSHACAGC